MINYVSHRKVMIIHLIAGLIKKILYKMKYFPELDGHNKNKIKVDLNLSNHAKKSDLKNHPL